MKSGSQIVTFEIRIDIADHKAVLSGRQLRVWLAIIHFFKKRGRRGIETIENAAVWVVLGFNIGNASVLFNRQILNVTIGTTNAL